MQPPDMTRKAVSWDLKFLRDPKIIQTMKTMLGKKVKARIVDPHTSWPCSNFSLLTMISPSKKDNRKKVFRCSTES